MYLANAARHQAIGDKTRRRIQKQGVTCRGYKLWTDAEDGICRDGYLDYAAISRALPHRSRCAIKSRCVSIGITKSSTWTAKRDTLFRKLYRTATTKVLYEAFPEMDRVLFSTVARSKSFQDRVSLTRRPASACWTHCARSVGGRTSRWLTSMSSPMPSAISRTNAGEESVGPQIITASCAPSTNSAARSPFSGGASIEHLPRPH